MGMMEDMGLSSAPGGSPPPGPGTEEGPDSMDAELDSHAASVMAAVQSKDSRRLKESLKAFIAACYPEE